MITPEHNQIMLEALQSEIIHAIWLMVEKCQSNMNDARILQLFTIEEKKYAAHITDATLHINFITHNTEFIIHSNHEFIRSNSTHIKAFVRDEIKKQLQFSNRYISGLLYKSDGSCKNCVVTCLSDRPDDEYGNTFVVVAS